MFCIRRKADCLTQRVVVGGIRDQHSFITRSASVIPLPSLEFDPTELDLKGSMMRKVYSYISLAVRTINCLLVDYLTDICTGRYHRQMRNHY